MVLSIQKMIGGNIRGEQKASGYCGDAHFGHFQSLKAERFSQIFKRLISPLQFERQALSFRNGALSVLAGPDAVFQIGMFLPVRKDLFYFFNRHSIKYVLN